MLPLYATPSDALAYPEVPTKTLVYPPPKKQAADRLTSVYCLCLICIVHLLLSKLFIYLHRQWGRQGSMTAC